MSTSDLHEPHATGGTPPVRLLRVDGDQDWLVRGEFDGPTPERAVRHCVARLSIILPVSAQAVDHRDSRRDVLDKGVR